MKRFQAVLLGDVQVGADRLGKPVCESREVRRASFRRAPWDRTRVNTPGNVAEIVRRTYFTGAPRSAFDGIGHVDVEGERWRVVDVSDNGRGCAVTVERAKP